MEFWDFDGKIIELTGFGFSNKDFMARLLLSQ